MRRMSEIKKAKCCGTCKRYCNEIPEEPHQCMLHDFLRDTSPTNTCDEWEPDEWEVGE